MSIANSAVAGTRATSPAVAMAVATKPGVSTKHKAWIFLLGTLSGVLAVVLFVLSDESGKPLYLLHPFCYCLADVAFVVYVGLFLVAYLPSSVITAMQNFHDQYSLPL